MMNRIEFEEVVARERLEVYAVFEAPDKPIADRVYLYQAEDSWVTVMTDERAVVQTRTERRFASENEALEDMVDALRVVKEDRGAPRRRPPINSTS